MNKLLIIIIIICAAGCKVKKGAENQELISSECRNYLAVSFNDLIENPDNFDKKIIKINGFYYQAFEESALYEHEKRRGTDAQGLWVDFDKVDLYKDSKLKIDFSKEVGVIGVFNSDDKGHLNQYVGEIRVLCVTQGE